MGDNQLRQSLVACFIVYPKRGQSWEGGDNRRPGPLKIQIILQVRFQCFDTGGFHKSLKPSDP